MDRLRTKLEAGELLSEREVEELCERAIAILAE
jgi:hypothetical protein